MVRSLLGRTTLGLLFNPMSALLGGSLKARIKRTLLFILKRNPFVTTLTILPFYVEPHLYKVSDGWIYDFQLWDLSSGQLANFNDLKNPTTSDIGSPLMSRVNDFSRGRNVVTSLGVQSKIKGVDGLVSAALLLNSEKYCFVIAGTQDKYAKELIESVSPGSILSIDRYLDDSELLELYACSAFIWCCYHPLYDQASGIFGRASQFGVCSILRSGSAIHKIAKTEGFPHLAISNAADMPLSFSRCQVAELTCTDVSMTMLKNSTATINQYLSTYLLDESNDF
jgi:hypothetical protein